MTKQINHRPDREGGTGTAAILGVHHLGTKDFRDVSSGVKIILLQVWSFSQSNLPDRKRVEEIMLLKVTKICILGTFSLEERLHTKLFPDRKETTEIIALSYSQVNDKS